MKLLVSFSLVCLLVLTTILMSCDSPSDSDHPPAPAELVIAPSTLQFDSTYVPKYFTITNAGEAALTWTVEENLDWITIDTDSGVCSTECDTVYVSINTDGLSTGTLSGHITVTSNGGSDSVDISIIVPYLYDGQYSGIYYVTVSYPAGPEGLFFIDLVMSDNSYWMTTSGGDFEGLCSPTGTYVTYGTDSICFIETSDGCEGIDDSDLNPDGVFVVQIDNDSLSLSQYKDGLMSDMWLVLGTSQSAILSVTPNTVDMGYDLYWQGLLIENTGEGTLQWCVAKSDDWIFTDPSNTYGTTTDEVDEAIVTVNRDLMLLGDFTGWVAVKSNGGSVSIPVKVSNLLPTGVTLEGTYDFITGFAGPSQVTTSYSITWRFSPSAYWMFSSDGDFCHPSGLYTIISEDSLILNQFAVACIEITVDPERFPIGPFEMSHTDDSFTMTQVSNDTCKIIRLELSQ